LRASANSEAKPRKRVSATSKPTDTVTIANVTITHPDRILWPDGGITKLALARYYAAVAEAKQFARSFSVHLCLYRLTGKSCHGRRPAMPSTSRTP
jgi:hypothetical protein